MNANLITELEAIRVKLDHLHSKCENETVAYELSITVCHLLRAIEWEKDRP